jgi:diguanylate cyclase (GGDEF)-like protein
LRYYIFVFLLYELLTGAYFYNLYTNDRDEYYQSTIKLVNNSFDSAINSYEMVYNDAYANQSDEIAKLVDLANGASKDKRDEIREILLNKYMKFFNFEKLNSLNGFHIFDIDGKSLLRFHKPLQHDDDIIKKRYSLQQLKKRFIYQKGFEIGIFQESFRFQYPLFYDGKYVGCYEYAVDPKAFISQMNIFYGDYHKLLFKADSLKELITNNIIDKNYKTVDVGSKQFYEKKHLTIKNMDKKRFEYILHLDQVKEALNSTKEVVIDYQYDSNYHSLTIKPIKDIEGKYFAYIMINSSNAKLHTIQNTFLIRMIFITILGLILYHYVYREMENRDYIKELINLQHDLILVTDGKSVENVNRAFLNFFGYKSLKEFKKDHPCICDMFLDEEGYLQPKHDNLNWIEYIQQDLSKSHKVKMLNKQNEEKIFSIDIEIIKKSYKVFMLFRDITNDVHEKELLEQRANLDTLTQIYNRNRFEYFLKLEIEKATRYGEIFSLIMFDIDHFKKINDTYGHDVGDTILKELTYLISEHTREVDIFARWGGEEFMIISQTNIYQSEMFAEKLRQIINNNSFSDVNSIVTCSFGITQYKENDTIESIVKRCDTMLYSAKESGRNTVASLR